MRRLAQQTAEPEKHLGRRATGQPTELELAILSVIWRDGPRTLRQLCDSVAPDRQQAKQAIHHTLKIMAEKGYVRIDKRLKSEGGMVYVALVARAKTASQMLHSLAARIFGGSIAGAIQHLVREGELDPSEIASLQNVLRENQEKKKR